MKVRYSRRALLELEGIHSYISQFNPRAAADVVSRIEGLCTMLGDFPGMGHSTERSDLRMLPVVRYPYVIFYTPLQENDEILILRIRHGRRSPLSPSDI
ncbi:MAG TPA: type II toxin-antitoxin system RelE/ParE family toxin [Hyphomicrobiaceae bacterium]|jgi:plasmid stabilization system protein ParE